MFLFITTPPARMYLNTHVKFAWLVARILSILLVNDVLLLLVWLSLLMDTFFAMATFFEFFDLMDDILWSPFSLSLLLLLSLIVLLLVIIKTTGV